MPFGELVLDLTLRSLARTPREHGLGEDVVEDLVAPLAALLH